MSQSSPIIANRYDFVYLFDVVDGNPNGDPDAGNQPRIDPETGEGLVTDVCVKRKIRNTVTLLNRAPGHRIYFQTQDAPDGDRILNRLHQQAIDVVTPEQQTADPASSAPAEDHLSGTADKWPGNEGKRKLRTSRRLNVMPLGACGPGCVSSFWDIRTFARGDVDERP